MSCVYCELSTTATLAGRPRVGARVPYLPITERDLYGTVDDPIGAGCESLNLAMYRLGALMLWPHDEEKRAEAFSVGVAQYGLKNAEFTLRNSGVAHTACLDEMIPWARSLADSLRPGDIQDYHRRGHRVRARPRPQTSDGGHRHQGYRDQASK